MKTALGLGIMATWVAGWMVTAHGAEIARWNSAGAVVMAGTFSPTSYHANAAVSNLTASANLLLTGSGAALNTFAAAGYSAADSNAAKTAGHYWQTSIQAQSGYSISYDSVAYRFRRANSGPAWAQWAYSTDGVNFTWLTPAGSNTTSYSEKSVTLSAVPALQSATGRIWFRLYAWGGGTANNAWGVFGQNADVLILSGTVATAGPVPPVVAFNPSGSQSVPVSNLLELAVSITPAGSGMQGWSMTPAYAGPASLSGGLFSFTPAAGDSGKTFSLKVVATNSVGATTGAVSIAVTPYTPPVPVIVFHPPGPYGIMATQTQKVGMAVTPAGSGIASWTLLPSNYAGSATLIGTNFTFATQEADGPSNYTLTVVATNVFGATTGTAEITVSEYIPAPPPGSVTVTFEDATGKSDYTTVTNTLSGRQWILSGATSIEANDKKFDTRALRIRSNDAQNPVKLCSLAPFSSGIESISLWYATYGNDNTNQTPQISIQISTNLNSDWITLDTFNTGASTVLVSRFVEVKVKVPVYFRLWSPSTGEDDRANVDNIVIAPYVVPTGYDAFLLQYNVTPGDPGTAEGDDLDGDGFTNLQEYNAVPKTNPYDEASHP